MLREGVRNFFLVGRSEADITKIFVYFRKNKFLPFVGQIFGGAVAHPAPPLTPSLVLLTNVSRFGGFLSQNSKLKYKHILCKT